MSKSEAQQVSEWLQTAPGVPEYIILYKPRSFPWNENPELIYSYSAKLAPFFRGFEDKTLANVAHFDGEKITIGGKAYTARAISADWGTQIYVYLTSKDEFNIADTILRFTEWHNKLSKGVKALVGVVMSISLAVVSLGSEIVKVLPSFPPSQKATQEQGRKKLKEAIRLGYYSLPNRPQANGLFYWQYSKNCDRRILVEGFSFMDPRAMQKISIRSTTEDGWAGLVEAHKKGESISVNRSQLTKGNALFQAMEELGVVEVITVPVPPEISPCPLGYLSIGLYVEPTDIQRLRYIESMRLISVSVNAWGRLAVKN